MSEAIDQADRPPDGTDLEVRGRLPHELAGRLVAVAGDGHIHWVHLHHGRAVHVVRRNESGATTRDLVVLGASVLAVETTGVVRELRTGIGPGPRVELAGRGRDLVAGPVLDAATGELHLVAHAPDGAQSHVVISAGALTRRSRSLEGAPSGIRSLLVAGEHVVLLSDGVVGLASRSADARTRWIATDVAQAQVFHAHASGDIVELLALTPALERWTLHPDPSSVHRDVIDPNPRRFARAGGADAEGAPRRAWTAGDRTVSHHDLVGSTTVHLDVAPGAAGPFALIHDPSRAGIEPHWLVVLVQDVASGTSELRVVDATDLEHTSVATARIPLPLALGVHLAWVPTTEH